MIKMIANKILTLTLLLWLAGCKPVAFEQFTPTGQSYPIDIDTPIITSVTAPTVSLATAVYKTTPMYVVSETSPIDKSSQETSYQFPLYSGETLALKGGLTDEARKSLVSGDTGFLLLAFADIPDTSLKNTLEAAGITLWIDKGWFFSEVPPDALELLEKLSQDGKLVFGGFLPPEGKIETRLSEEIQGTATGTSQISVIFMRAPEESTKKQVEALFEDVNWPQHIIERGPIIDGKIQIKNIKTLAKIPIIIGILKAGGPVSQ